MPLYGGSIAGGYSNALDAIARQNLEKQQLAQMLWNMQQSRAQQAAMGPAGRSLYDWAAQTPAPTPPMPGQSSAPGPSSGPPVPPGVGAMGGPGMIPGGGGVGAQGGGPGGLQPWKPMPPMPTTGSLMGESKIIGQDQASAPAVGIGAAPLPNTPSSQDQTGIGQPSLMQAPGMRDMLRLMKQNGVPEDQVVNVLGSVNPIFATEYRAVIGAQKAAIDAYKATMGGKDVESKVETRAGTLETKRSKLDETQKYHEALKTKWDTEHNDRVARIASIDKRAQASLGVAKLNNDPTWVRLHDEAKKAEAEAGMAMIRAKSTPNLSAAQLADLEKMVGPLDDRAAEAVRQLTDYGDQLMMRARGTAPGAPAIRKFNPATGKIE